MAADDEFRPLTRFAKANANSAQTVWSAAKAKKVRPAGLYCQNGALGPLVAASINEEKANAEADVANVIDVARDSQSLGLSGGPRK